MGYLVVHCLALCVSEGALGDILRVGLLGPQLDFLLQFCLKLRVGAPEEVVLQLQVLYGFLVLLDLLSQGL